MTFIPSPEIRDRTKERLKPLLSRVACMPSEQQWAGEGAGTTVVQPLLNRLAGKWQQQAPEGSGQEDQNPRVDTIFYLKCPACNQKLRARYNGKIWPTRGEKAGSRNCQRGLRRPREQMSPQTTHGKRVQSQESLAWQARGGGHCVRAPNAQEFQHTPTQNSHMNVHSSIMQNSAEVTRPSVHGRMDAQQNVARPRCKRTRSRKAWSTVDACRMQSLGRGLPTQSKTHINFWLTKT